jgi:hypothetical protein
MLVGHLFEQRPLLCDCVRRVRHMLERHVRGDLFDCGRLCERDVSRHHMHRHPQGLQRRRVRTIHRLDGDRRVSTGENETKRNAVVCRRLSGVGC